MESKYPFTLPNIGLLEAGLGGIVIGQAGIIGTLIAVGCGYLTDNNAINNFSHSFMFVTGVGGELLAAYVRERDKTKNKLLSTGVIITCLPLLIIPVLRATLPDNPLRYRLQVGSSLFTPAGISVIVTSGLV